MKSSRKYERIYAVVDSACRSQELDYARTKTGLNVAKQRAEQLLALSGPSTSAMAIFQDMWSAQLVKAVADVGRLDQELAVLGGAVRLAQLRRDKAGERLQGERSAKQSQKQEQDVSSSLELSMQLRRVRFR